MLEKPKLLIVDEDVSIRTSLSLIFSALGYRVRTREDGFSALSEITMEIPDVLLCDLNLVRMTGSEFLLIVRHSFPSIRVIAMGGVFSGDRVPSGIAADAFYQKGAGPAPLIEKVEAMTQPKRSTSRLSMETLFGFRVFEEIPSHPPAERLKYPPDRSLVSLVSRKDQACEIFPVAGVTRTQEVCSS